MTTTRVPECKCPICGHKLDAATAAPGQGDPRPDPGDFSVCIKCGEVLVFKPDLRVAVPTLTELLKLDPEGHDIINRAQRIIRAKRLI